MRSRRRILSAGGVFLVGVTLWGAAGPVGRLVAPEETLIPGAGELVLPQSLTPALALFTDAGFTPVALTGVGFGVAGPSSALEVWMPSGVFTIESEARCADDGGLPCIAVWVDTQVVAKLPADSEGVRLQVRTAAGRSAAVPAQTYAYDWYDTDASWCRSAGTNPHPLALAVDASHRVWINEEFHVEFKMLDPAIGRVSDFPIGHPPVGPFALARPGFDVATHTSANGEDVLVDPRGRVWLSEGGFSWYDGPHPNHSRVVMYDPATERTRVYNLPGDNNGMFGLAYEPDYEPGRDRIWFTEMVRMRRGIVGAPAKLAWFDPELAPFDDGRFDFAVPPDEACGGEACPGSAGDLCAEDEACAPACVDGACPDGTRCASSTDCAACCLDDRMCGVAGGALVHCRDGTARPCLYDSQCAPVCGPGLCQSAIGRACFSDADCALASQACPALASNPDCAVHEYELPDGLLLPGHVAVGRDGSVWFTGYWGTNSIGRLVPATGTVSLFPLPPARCEGPEMMFLGSAPWELTFAPNGDVLVTEWADSTVGRFDVSRVDDPACALLTGTAPDEHNPCISEMDVPGVSLASQRLHSLAFDRRGNLWFTQFGVLSDPDTTTSVGYVTRDWRTVALFPGLSLYPFFTQGGNCPDEDPPESRAYAELVAALARAAGVDDLASAGWPPGIPTALWTGPDPWPWRTPPSNGPSGSDAQSSFRSFRGSGIAVDPITDDVWFGDYCRKRIGRLRPVTTDVALAQPTWQSSTAGGAGSERAVDGNIDGDVARGDSVAMTDDGVENWWEVDLGEVLWIDAIDVWNRSDCCGERLHNFYVLVSDQPFVSTTLAEVLRQPEVRAFRRGRPVDTSAWFGVHRPGRYVRVQLAGRGPLALAEVIVLGGRMPECTPSGADVECDDGNDCTADRCRHGRCEHTCSVEPTASTDAPPCAVALGRCVRVGPLPTPTPLPPPCAGDCNGDQRVTVDELTIGVAMALSSATATRCDSFDADGDGVVRITDLVLAVNHALTECPA